MMTVLLIVLLQQTGMKQIAFDGRRRIILPFSFADASATGQRSPDRKGTILRNHGCRNGLTIFGNLHAHCHALLP
jgi:hypothetical protein